MFAVRTTVLVASCLMLLAGGARAQETDWLKGSVDDQLRTLAGVQPGLGLVMIEYSTHFTDMYYAAKGGNWALADYEFKEALEIQEVGETTRPASAAALEAFESTYLEPLKKAIAAKDFETFSTAFDAGIQGCNGCHASKDYNYPFIKYELPKVPPSPLSYMP